MSIALHRGVKNRLQLQVGIADHGCFEVTETHSAVIVQETVTFGLKISGLSVDDDGDRVQIVRNLVTAINLA